MRITVEYFGTARDAAGASTETIEFGGDTVAGLLAEVSDRRPRLHRLLLIDGLLAPGLLLTLGDRNATTESILHDGDTLTIIPAISGGAR